jgi:hypothetical protein
MTRLHASRLLVIGAVAAAAVLASLLVSSSGAAQAAPAQRLVSRDGVVGFAAALGGSKRCAGFGAR